MGERDIEKLKDLPVPPPSDRARARAIAAAIDTYDAHQNAPRIYSQPTAQASDGTARPTPQSHPETRRRFMQFTHSQYALAASIAALIIAAPIAFQISREQAPGDPRLRTAETRDEVPKDASPALPAPEPEPLVVAVPKPAPPASEEKRKLDGLSAIGRAERQRTDAEGNASVQESAAVQSALGQLATEPAAPGTYAAARKLAPLSKLGADAVADLAFSHQLDGDRDGFDARDVGAVKQAASDPVSTFSIDVDTASYAFVRRALNEGRLPPKGAVRTEEMINYFDYAYPAPSTANEPFKPTISVVPSPWNTANKLVHIGLKGYELQSAERPRANLVLLVDVSGSMSGADRLPLVQNAFRLLVDELKPDDTVSIVTYAAGSGIALEPTKVADKSKILNALSSLGASGSTAGAAGIEDAYRLASQSFDAAAVNRVIMATDGDFNVGLTDLDALKGLIERKRDSGIFLSILGVGRGNYQDRLMQTLAQNGNGIAAYADTLSEARKILVEESSSTLFPIAKDVKIQVEWNPARVSEYRLVGYETRALRREDFNNDKVDAGDVGSGHTVTAIYEITPVGAVSKLADDLRYGSRTAASPPAAVQTAPADTPNAASSEYGFLKLRYKLPKSSTSMLIEQPVTDQQAVPALADAPADVRFSIAVAGFAELLRGSPNVSGFTFDTVHTLAAGARGDDPFGYRAEFLNLVRLAKSSRP